MTARTLTNAPVTAHLALSLTVARVSSMYLNSRYLYFRNPCDSSPSDLTWIPPFNLSYWDTQFIIGCLVLSDSQFNLSNHPTSRGATSVLTYLALYLHHSSIPPQTRACVRPDGYGDSTVARQVDETWEPRQAFRFTNGDQIASRNNPLVTQKNRTKVMCQISSWLSRWLSFDNNSTVQRSCDSENL